MVLSFPILLIRLVKVRGCLYDKNDRDYNDIYGIKQQKWEEVVQGLVDAGYTRVGGRTIDVSIVQRRFRNMRDHLIKTLRRYTSSYRSGGLGCTKIPRNTYFREMRFIVEQLETDETTKEIYKSFIEACDKGFDHTVADGQPDAELDIHPDDNTTAMVESGDELSEDFLSVPVKSESSVVATIHNELPIVEEIPPKRPKLKRPARLGLNTLPTYQRVSPDSTADDDSIFGRLIGNQLRQLPGGETKDRLKVGLLQLVVDAKYKVRNEPEPSQ